MDFLKKNMEELRYRLLSCSPVRCEKFKLSNKRSSSPAVFGLSVGIHSSSGLLSSQVSSRGLVLAAGTKNASSSSLSLTPTLAWSPEAWVTVYCVRADGELISDTVHVPTDQPNQVLCPLLAGIPTAA